MLSQLEVICEPENQHAHEPLWVVSVRNTVRDMTVRLASFHDSASAYVYHQAVVAVLGGAE